MHLQQGRNVQLALDAGAISRQIKVMNTDQSAPKTYTLFEDVQGLILASAQAALGIHLLRAAGIMTGGSAGMALIISYATGWNFSAVFFAVNLPFFALAYRFRGLSFCLKSVSTVVLVSIMAELLGPLLQVHDIHPATAAVLFGVSTGIGLLGLFRHKGSLGGMSIMALILQDRYGIKAGYTQMAHDLALFAIAAFIIPLDSLAWSALGMIIVNAVIAINHRRDWYVVT